MKPSMREIARATADHFQITIDDVRFGPRKQKFSWPRQIAMYLGRHMSDFSLPKLAEFFGNRDHTTAMHGIASVEEWARDDDEAFRDLVAIAAAASGLSIDRQRKERAWAHELHRGKSSSVPMLPAPPRRIIVPERSVWRPARRIPVTLPSEFAPPSMARLMGARA